MFGKPIPDCGSGGTSVPSRSFGTRLRGGLRPSVAHSSRAMNSARCTGAEFSGLSDCWQSPLFGVRRSPGWPVPCRMLDMK